MVLVWDNLNVHLRAELRAFTAAQPWLEVFQLPSYAPDLNPVESTGESCAEAVFRASLRDGFASLDPASTHVDPAPARKTNTTTGKSRNSVSGVRVRN